MEEVAIDNNSSSGSRSNSSSNRKIIPHPYVKAWAAIARIDGGTGHLLGHAMRDGLYGIRVTRSYILRCKGDYLIYLCAGEITTLNNLTWESTFE